MLVQIRIAGIGGQGIKVAGNILGEAATECGYYASQVVTYTPAARGGPIYTDIQVSDKPIQYPVIEKPQVLATIAPIALQTQISCLSEWSELVVDSQVYKGLNGQDLPTNNIVTASFIRAAEKVGSPTVVNMVLLGFLEANVLSLGLGKESLEDFVRSHEPVNRIGLGISLDLGITPLSFQRSIEKSTPERFRKLNLRAFRVGWDLEPDQLP